MTYIADITCKSSTSELQKIRHTVKQACVDFDFDLAKTNSIILALDEACANVMRHSCQYSENFKLEIQITREDEYAVFLVIDNCSSLSPDVFVPGPDALLKPGGLGLQLIHQVMDSVTLLAHSGQGNRLELKIKL